MVSKTDLQSYNTACATESGEVYVWGVGTNGELGLGDGGGGDEEGAGSDEEDRHTSGQHSSAAAARVKMTMPTLVRGGLLDKKVLAVSVGGAVSAAVTRDGEVFTWGDNNGGNDGEGDDDDDNAPVVGAAEVPTLVRGLLLGKCVVGLSAGGYHVTAVTADGELYTWGKGTCGRLGHGDERALDSPKLVAGALRGKHVVSASAGCIHTVVRKKKSTARRKTRESRASTPRTRRHNRCRFQFFFV